MNQGLSLGGRKLRGFAVGDPSSPTSTSTDAHSPTSTEVRSPTRTRTATEVRSPTSTSTEVRSPTNTSTEAYTADNFTATVTGGAGAGATTTVNIFNFSDKPRNNDPSFPSHEVQPPQSGVDLMREAMATPPPTNVMQGMLREVMSTPPPKDVALDLMRETMAPSSSSSENTGVSSYPTPMGEQIYLGGCPKQGFHYDRAGLDGPSNLIIAASKRPLDASLPQATENAVLVAVSQETDPAKLRAFAQSLLPQYPVAASVLNARAVTLDPSVGVSGVFRYEGLRLPGLDGPGHHTVAESLKHKEQAVKIAEYIRDNLPPEPPAIGVGFKFQPFHGIAKLAKDAVKVGPLAFVPGAGAAAILAMAAVEAGHTKVGKNIGKDLAKNPVLKGIATAYTKGYQQANPAFFAKTLVLGGADDLLHHKSLGQAFKDAWHTTGGYLVDKAKIASNIAGVPPQATAALTAAGNLAQGKPLPKDLLSAAGAVVGAAVGPAATAALQQGAALGNQLAAQGAPVLAQIAAAKNALPPNVTHAFDSGLAISTAQQLQSKGYGAAHALMPDQGKILTALSTPGNLLPGAIKNLQQALPADAANLAHDAAAKLIASPELAKLSSTDLASKLNIAEPVARAALASMSHEVPGAPLLHPQRLEAVVGKHKYRPRPPGTPDPAAPFVAQYGAQAAPTAGGAASYGPYPQAVGT